MTRVFEDVADWLACRESLKQGNMTLGLVPTMGALHEGHVSLVRRSLAENERTLVTIFVNPTQFNDPQDLERYPRPFARDLATLESAGAHFLLSPPPAQLYPDDYAYRVHEQKLSAEMEGLHRPGHFDGMLSVVLKLLLVSGADRAYFGEKDHQQLQLVKGMARAFFVPVEIIGCPTLREPDGLAMSSRNALLSPAERAQAPAFHSALQDSPTAAQARARLERLGFAVDYIEDHGQRRFGAVRLGRVRLIDNISLSGRLP